MSLPLLATGGLGLLMLPGGLRLQHYRRRSLDDVVNLNDAVRVCRASGLDSWELVTVAQRLIGRKFSTYSTLNLWDPPGRAFIFGMGYCTQYNLALKRVLDRLNFETQAVFALKTWFNSDPSWTMGHTWLRVTLDGATRDVCAGNLDNEPGSVDFEPLSRVHVGNPLTFFITHLGMILFCGVLEWWALLTGNEPPAWTFEERNR